VTTEEIVRIAKIPIDVLRNLQITACYHDLSLAMADRIGKTANWCTFATWASRQAGQTIRGEDLRAKLFRELHLDRRVTVVITLLGAMAKENGAFTTIDQLKETALAHLVEQASTRAADAVARGNKKVFEEIGFHFARFLQTCANDHVYTESSINNFVAQLQQGDPPVGQRYLQQAFRRYYRAMFETDKQKATELNFHANLEIGFHEQTRLQPEIAAALNAGVINPNPLLAKLTALIFPQGATSGWRRLLNWAAGKTGLLEKHVEALAALTGKASRKVVTTHLMTLTFPPGKTVLLGSDVAGSFPASLAHLHESELRQFLAAIDPTADSVVDSGAVDWSDLKERLHFIVDLFRTRHEEYALFGPAFTDEQLALITDGKVPACFDW
jgi:hypothetical protein